jgi:thermopsin
MLKGSNLVCTQKRERRMKRVFSLIMVCLLCLSMFSMFVPKTRAATAPLVVNSSVNESSSSITLSGGADIYLYGYGTGGGRPSGDFAYGQYTSLTNQGGYVVASLAITTSDNNYFSTGSGYPVIGGVGVQSFSSYSSSFGTNNSPAAPSASDSFTVATSGSLVVVIAIGGDEQSLSVSGLPGLQIDAAWPGSPWNALEILHTYLDAGTYVVTEYTSQSAAGQTPAYAGDLIGVFVFTPSGSSSESIGLFTPAINGLTVDFNGGASPGNQVTYIQWSWGDGFVDNAWFPHSHTYTSSGIYFVTVTAHYNDGSTVSTSTSVNVYPGEMTGGDRLTISAGQGGSVSYTSSLGSGTIQAGQSKTLYLAFLDGATLEANPNQAYDFSSWTASSGITGLNGAPIDVASPSIMTVVSSNAEILANFAVLPGISFLNRYFGFQESTGVASYGLYDYSGNFVPDTISTDKVIGYAKITSFDFADSTLQLNVMLNVNTETGTQIFWLQNVLQFGETLYPDNPLDNIWNYSSGNANGMSSENGGHGQISNHNGHYYYYRAPALSLNVPFSVYLIINESVLPSQQGVEVSFSYIPSFGSLQTYDTVTIPVSGVQSASIMVTPYELTGAPAVAFDAEFVWGGPPNGANGGITTFGNLNSYMGIYYDDNGITVPFPSVFTFGTDTGERAANLQVWADPSGYAKVVVGTFDDSSLSNNFNPPLTQTTSTAIFGQSAEVDQTAITGVKVDVSGFPIENGGASLTVTSTDEGATPPSGTGALQIDGVDYYDVQISSSVPLGPSAEALVYISNPDFKSQEVMSFWSSTTNSWVSVPTQFIAPDTLCGTFSPSDLGGTPIMILNSNTCAVTFSQMGVGSDFGGSILMVDETPYNAFELPLTFYWNVGSIHTFAFKSPLTVAANAEQYVWTATTGLSSMQSDSINIATYGSIVGNYRTQYYLRVNSAQGAPTPPTGWFDAGTQITASVGSPAAGSTGTRYVCTGWSGTGSIPVSGTASSVAFTISAASTITWNWKTQYQASFAVSPSAAGTVNPSVTAYFDAGSTISISATALSGYTFWNWFSKTSYITFASSSSATTTATINGPAVITATFALLVSGNRHITLIGIDNVVIITGGNDVIDGTQATATTVIKTGAGNDIINLGGGNNNVIETAGGNDIITTGNGNNTITITGNGNYQITTGSGNDQIQITGDGNSIINAGDGNNTVTVSGKGNNQITTGSGNDVVVAGNGNNIIKTGAGNDTITVGNGNNYVDGGAGYDVCIHGTGHNTILNCEKT